MRRTLTLILALAAVLLAAAPALADPTQRIYTDCQDGRIDGHYTQRQFQKALDDLPADIDEYTDCRSVIRRGQLTAAGGGGGRGSGSGQGAGGGGGAATGGGGAGGGGATSRDPLAGATPQERKAFDDAVAAGGRPVTLAGQAITPGAAGLHRLAAQGHDLPVPLIALLALVAAGLAAGAATLTWNRFRGVRARGAG
jgi:hypothetical protein